MNDPVKNGRGTTAGSRADHGEQDVHNVFYLLYIVLLWIAIAMAAWEISAILNKDELDAQYCKGGLRKEAATAPTILPASAAQAGTVDVKSTAIAVPCSPHSYAIFVEAQAYEMKYGIRDLSITLAVAGFLLLSALRSFFGVHFAVSNPEWNEAQRATFKKRGWNPEWPSQADVVLSGAHIALLGILALVVKGDSALRVALVICAQAALTLYYNFRFWDALCDRFKSSELSKYRYGLIILVDLAIALFALSLLGAVLAHDGLWKFAAWVAFATGCLFVAEVILTYGKQICQSVKRTYLSITYVWFRRKS